MKLSKEMAVNLHRELWRYLAATGTPRKMDWPEWENINKKYGYIINNCFCCQYAGQEAEKHGHQVIFEDGYIDPEICKYCPIDWTEGGSDFCEKHGMGLYAEWEATNYDDKSTRRRVAMRIAQLPVKESMFYLIKNETLYGLGGESFSASIIAKSEDKSKLTNIIGEKMNKAIANDDVECIDNQEKGEFMSDFLANLEDEFTGHKDEIVITYHSDGCDRWQERYYIIEEIHENYI